MLKVVFMGTPDFAKESLKAIYDAGYPILGVVTNPDKPKGRGMKMVSSPVKEFANANNIPVFQPLKVKQNAEFLEQMKQLNPDIICVVAYGKILPQELLEIPPKGCINVHGSLLPKYRGAAPIQWAIINGERKTGITTMHMDAGMDTGDMLLKETVAIGEEETTGELWEKLSKIGGKLIVETLQQIEDGTVVREKQPAEYTVAPMLTKEIAEIDWHLKTAQEIKNLVRGLNPILGAYTFVEGKKIKLWKVNVISNEDFTQMQKNGRQLTENDKKDSTCSFIHEATNGSILLADAKLGLFFKAKDAIVEAVEIQAEGSRKMTAKEYLRGNPLV